MTAEKELLKRLEYTSSEDEFLDYDDAKENCVNLNRRKSKMGRLSSKTSVKQDRRSKRKSYPDAKETAKGKERRRTRSGTTSTNSKDVDIMKEARKPAAVQPNGFITTRRLTAGISGIFGNSKASNIVKRRGTRSIVDVGKRKMSVEVQQQVNRDLQRILKQPSLGSQKDVNDDRIVNDSEDETGQSPSVFENSFESRQTHIGCQTKGLASGSSSTTTRSCHNVKTPHTELSKEVPFKEISRRLKESLVISELFPGKSYLDELKEDLCKTLKQQISILKNDELSYANATPAVTRPDIAPISVARRTQRTDSKEKTYSKDHRSSTVNEISNSSIKDSDKNTFMVTEESTTLVKTGSQSHDCKGPQHFNCMCPNNKNQTDQRIYHINTRNSTAFKFSPTSNMVQGGSWLQATEQEIHATSSHIVQASGSQSNRTHCLPKLRRITGNIEDQNLPTADIFSDYAHLHTHQQQLMQHQQHIPQLQQQYQQQQQHDSGTFSYESIARGQLHSNRSLRDPASFDSQYQGFNPQFFPRRQGNTSHDKRFPSTESSCNRYADHDYATRANSFDILHYAGALNDDFDMDCLEASENRTRGFSAVVQLPKKPCLDTPTSPFKLYRMKMF